MKKLILLPVVLLALAACNSSSVVSSSVASEESSVEESSSVEASSSASQFVEDTAVYRIVGTFSDPVWTANHADWIMEKGTTPETNIYSVTLDLYIDDEWCITKNGDWPDQIGFSGSFPAIAITDTGTTMVEGGGYAVKNFKVTQHGNYTITWDTGMKPALTPPRTIEIVRNGDPIVAPPTEVFWRVVGTMNTWAAENETHILIETTTLGTYEITMDLYIGDEFKVVKNGTGWNGASALGTITPEGALAGTDNITVTQHGNYTIQVVDGETDVINATRLGDPIVPPVLEDDNGVWRLSGTLAALGGADWDPANDAFLMPVTAVAGVYSVAITLNVDTAFKVTKDTGWDNARGFDKVTAAPDGAFVEDGGNIKTVIAGEYIVTFTFGSFAGSIVIEKGMFNLPATYTPISTLIDSGVATTSYTTRGIVVGVNGGSIFIEDPITKEAINVYESPAVLKDTLLLGNVIDATGVFKLYNLAAELDTAVLTLVAAAAPAAHVAEPFVIENGAALTARKGTDTALSGQLVRLNNVTVGPVGTPAANQYVITFDGVTLNGYSFFSLAYETATPATGTGRTAINSQIGGLNTGAVTFDIIGVLYHASSTAGTWRLGLVSTSQIVLHVS